MRYAIIDDEGATIDSTEAWSDLLARLHELDDREPGVLSQLSVLRYDESGRRSGDAESAELLTAQEATRRVFIGSFHADAWVSGYATLVVDPGCIIVGTGASAYPGIPPLHWFLPQAARVITH